MKIEKNLTVLRASKLAVSRSAVIDIGSNSVRLVVYEGPARAPAVIFNEKVAAGLGRGLAINGRIAGEDAMRGLMALRRYALLAKHMEVKDLQCVATAAVRDAENGPEFIASAAEAGLKIRLLSGEEEAEAAGYGVVSAIPDAHGIAVDLGAAHPSRLGCCAFPRCARMGNRRSSARCARCCAPWVGPTG